MAMDTPARIAVLGAGPIGLEAALYARYLGYDVDIYEQGEVLDSIRRWSHVRMFSPWHMNVTPLGLAAILAQDEGWRPLDADRIVTAQELIDGYLRPLARTDLLADSIQERTCVLAVGREGPLKGDLIGDDSRAEFSFRILLRDASGVERHAEADVVIDATGTYRRHNWLGTGGVPAVGEMSLGERIEYRLPDILGRDRADYASRHTLLIGSGYSAITNLVALAELARQSESTRITWITRNALGPNGDVVERIPNDRLPERDRLASNANRLVASQSSPVTHWPSTTVEAVQWDAAREQFAVRLRGAPHSELIVDRVIANVGFRPQRSLHEELQVHECYATQGPMKLAASLLKTKSQDCLDQPAQGAQTLLNPEPDFYILGAKSHGRGSQFLLSAGHQQIRELFTIIGDRADLNLYTTFQGLAP